MSLACLPRRPAVSYLCLVDVSDTSITDFLAVHSKTGVVIVAACVFVSLSLIARLWVVHCSASVLKEVVWSILLWCLYSAGHFTVRSSSLRVLAKIALLPNTPETLYALREITHRTSNQTMKPTAPPRNTFRLFATTPCRGLSPSR